MVNKNCLCFSLSVPPSVGMSRNRPTIALIFTSKLENRLTTTTLLLCNIHAPVLKLPFSYRTLYPKSFNKASSLSRLCCVFGSNGFYIFDAPKYNSSDEIQKCFINTGLYLKFFATLGVAPTVDLPEVATRVSKNPA